MPELEVRPVTQSDLPGVEPLVDDALSRMHTLRGGPALLTGVGLPADTTASALAGALCGSSLVDVVTVVATLDGAVVGFAAGVRTAEGLDLFAVHTARSMRRRRIGTALLDAMRAAAADEQRRFEALALPGDQTIKSLMESAGYRARLLRMSDGR